MTAIATAAAVFAGLLLSTEPWGAALFMAALGAVVAWSYTRGWQLAATYVATQAALAAIAAPRMSVLAADSYPPSSPTSAAAVAGMVLFGGLWVSAVGFLFLYDLPAHPSEVPDRQYLIAVAITLIVVLGVGTFVAIDWVPGGNVWWVLLTALVVLTPQAGQTPKRALERAGGTILGGTVATVLILLVSERSVILAIGVIAALLTAVAFLRLDYWVFTAFLTMALVLLTFPVGRVVRGSAERIGYTVLSAVLVVLLFMVVRRLMQRYTTVRGRVSAG